VFVVGQRPRPARSSISWQAIFDLERVGDHPVRGFSDPIELFAYHG
jgi:hypothetical protein